MNSNQPKPWLRGGVGHSLRPEETRPSIVSILFAFVVSFVANILIPRLYYGISGVYLSICDLSGDLCRLLAIY